MLVAAIVLMFASGVYAGMPIDKGNMFLAGGFSFTSAGGDLYKDFEDNSQTILMINPEFGYFFAPGIMAGAELGYSSWSWGDLKDTMFGFGPMVRYYINMNKELTEAKGAIFPYLGVHFLYSSCKFENGETLKWTTMTYGGEIGAVFMISDAIGAFGQVAFDSESEKQKEPIEGDSVSGTVMGAQIGITYFIIK
jgi:hypothetical protein